MPLHVMLVLKCEAVHYIKRGDLAGVCVYKLNSQNQVMLLACEYDPQTRLLLLLGSHENFYRDLKR
jgi:hypothetical protein